MPRFPRTCRPISMGCRCRLRAGLGRLGSLRSLAFKDCSWLGDQGANRCPARTLPGLWPHRAPAWWDAPHEPAPAGRERLCVHAQAGLVPAAARPDQPDRAGVRALPHAQHAARRGAPPSLAAACRQGLLLRTLNDPVPAQCWAHGSCAHTKVPSDRMLALHRDACSALFPDDT